MDIDPGPVRGRFNNQPPRTASQRNPALIHFHKFQG